MAAAAARLTRLVRLSGLTWLARHTLLASPNTPRQTARRVAAARLAWQRTPRTAERPRVTSELMARLRSNTLLCLDQGRVSSELISATMIPLNHIHHQIRD